MPGKPLHPVQSPLYHCNSRGVPLFSVDDIKILLEVRGRMLLFFQTSTWNCLEALAQVRVFVLFTAVHVAIFGFC